MCNKFGKANAGDIDRRAFLQASVAVTTIAAIAVACLRLPELITHDHASFREREPITARMVSEPGSELLLRKQVCHSSMHNSSLPGDRVENWRAL